MWQSIKTSGEIMTRKIVTVGENDSLLTAYQQMQDKKFRHLPVTTAQGQIIGIISDRDIQRALTPLNDPFSAEAISFKLDPAYRVRDFMSWPIQTIHESESVLNAARMMLKAKISGLLVVGADSSPRGIMTTDDLVKYLVSILEKSGEQEPKLLVEALVSAFGTKLSYLD